MSKCVGEVGKVCADKVVDFKVLRCLLKTFHVILDIILEKL